MQKINCWFNRARNLRGKKFIDVGSGSGLFSLAARNLDLKVCSFDYDSSSVSSTNFLKKKYYKNDKNGTF